MLIAGQKVPELCDEPLPEALQAGASRPAAASGAPRPPQLGGWESQRKSHPVEHYHTEHIECLNDIVRMCTLAHRRGLGNVVWLSYNCGTLGKPQTAKPTLIWSASTLVALTVNGARALHDLIVHAKPHHIDLWLRAQLEEHTETLGCCYVNPPIGSYEEHVSGCEPSVGLRKSGFYDNRPEKGRACPRMNTVGWYDLDSRRRTQYGG